MKLLYWPRIGLARAQIVARLQAIAGVELVVVEDLDELLRELPGATGLVLPDAPVGQARRVVQALAVPGSTLRWMHFITAGRNGFEAAGLPPGVAITWTAGAVSPTVAEHAMALLLALARGVPEMLTLGARCEWDGTLVRRLNSLEGGTLLIVGFGHIGRQLAQRARAFGMRVEAVTRTPRADPLLDAVHPMAALGERLPHADAVVLCAALTPQTAHLIDTVMLARCKPGAWLVNVARGGLVDQDALLAALASGRLGGAALDVTDPEPLPPEHPLWRTPGLIISPHCAGGGSPASMDRVARGAAENCMRLITGQALVDRIA